MQLTVPIYVEVRREGAQAVHHCRPVFFQGPHGADPHLGLAMSKLSKRLKQMLDGLGSQPNHYPLATCGFAPLLETHVLKLSLALRDRTARCKLLFVVFPALGRRIAFAPALDQLWFEVGDGQRLDERAVQVLTRHFRDREKLARQSDEAGDGPESISLAGQAWVTTVDVNVTTRLADQKKLQQALATLLDDTRVDGGLELQRVGRCLDWLYPDELHQAVARDREVDQLHRLLENQDNRPVVLVGPRLVGKTTVLHGAVRRRVARRGRPFAAKRNVWLLSPQRLISGMMFVGQWEGRVQAILKEARRRQHVLYFDDFLGLYHAGISRDASLSVADVLKPLVLRREVRVLAEMTPEAWQALQERDRGLADQFHVLRIDPTSEAATRQVMLEVHRQLEAQQRCEFKLDGLPTIVQLHQCYIRDAAFPGKSAAFSRHLAQKFARQSISRQDIHHEFHLKTGLSLALLDDRHRLDRDAVVKSLQARLVGQDEAVQAAADVVTVAKARLADPARPLATFLFLGPTGVGKTQCAKALAEVMFTDASRLLRFDMNEFVTSQAVAQLVGTFGEPDGLLTAAVRRQPFAVVLLDEIEKAHPDVFDLLLQVTGEGRLTDALGRTADFTNTVIVMTSNLGATAGTGQIGLAPGSTSRQQAYVKAAENFFRPEFFNRLDRVIPFSALSREEMRKIADLLLADIFQRDGLVRRRCALAVESPAMERIVDAGYHPQFGARALKRAIEQQLVHPVAASLSSVQPELPAVISVLPHPDGVTAHVHPLESVPPVAPSHIAQLEPAEQLARVEQFTDRVEEELAAARPAGTTARGLSPEQVRFYALKEQLHRVREMAGELGESLRVIRRGVLKPQIAPKAPGSEKAVARTTIYREIPQRRFLRDIQAAQDIHDYLRDVAAAVPRAGEIETRLAALRNEAIFLHAMHASANQPDRAVLIVHPLNSAARHNNLWITTFVDVYREQFSFDTVFDYYVEGGPFKGYAIRIAGPAAWMLAQAEAGVHLFLRRHENLVPFQMCALPATGDDVRPVIEQFYQRREQWLASLATAHTNPQRERGVTGQSQARSASEGPTEQIAPDDNPFPLGPLVRIYDEAGPTLDLRSGLTHPSFPDAPAWKSFLLAGLPLPPEFQV